MANITIGTGATLLETAATERQTQEQMTLSMLQFLQAKERDATANPNGRNYLRSDHSDDNTILTFSCSIPVNYSIESGSGALRIIANEYLTGITFSNGSGGTMQATTAAQSLIESIARQEAIENTGSQNPLSADYIDWSIRKTENQYIFEASGRLPTTALLTPDGSALQISAVSYLV
ncbi:hypothetical protein NG799_02310 [Laspinema sp. D1]|uniref:Uncharacterized protein n=1 Tax=Laspinema palackyanum D2a TaxID=2953684 RepID=A0ABT2MNR2_9CYAN|nr:hypothetical protein [Laspinema sp. D2a]